MIQKIIGIIFPPYRYSLLTKDNRALLGAILNSLPSKYIELTDALNKSGILYFEDWKLMPEYKFISISYTGMSLRNFKKEGQIIN